MYILFETLIRRRCRCHCYRTLLCVAHSARLSFPSIDCISLVSRFHIHLPANQQSRTQHSVTLSVNFVIGTVFASATAQFINHAILVVSRHQLSARSSCLFKFTFLDARTIHIHAQFDFVISLFHIIALRGAQYACVCVFTCP